MPVILHLSSHMGNNPTTQELIFAQIFFVGTPEKPTVTNEKETAWYSKYDITCHKKH